MTEQQRYFPDQSTQQVDIPEPHTPACEPEVLFSMDKAAVAHDLLPLGTAGSNTFCTGDTNSR